MEILQNSAGVIEYIDSIESENALIGRDIKKILINNKTHCEKTFIYYFECCSTQYSFPFTQSISKKCIFLSTNKTCCWCIKICLYK